MKKVNYNLSVSERENILLQLRLLLPEVDFRKLEIMYYVWKYPTEYAQKMLADKMYASIPAIQATLVNLVNMELLDNKIEEGKKLKIVHPSISKGLVNDSVQISLTLNQK